MGPEQGVSSPQAAAPAPAPEQNMMTQGVSAKKGKGALYGMVLLGILAVGGIGFGVWTMMDSNSQKEALNSQISSLKQQNSELSDQIASLQDEIDNYKQSQTQTETVVWSGDNAEVVDGVFYIKNAQGDRLAQSTVTNITSITSCEYQEANSALRCVVVAANGEGWFQYDTVKGELTSSFDAE